jgi:two-component system, sensor histidine kinase YesM
MKIRRIQTTLTRTFALIVVATIVMLGAIALSFLRRTLVEAARSSTMHYAFQLSRIVDNYVAYIDDIALLTMGDARVREYMKAPPLATSAERERIASFLESIRDVRKDVDGIFLLPVSGQLPSDGLLPHRPPRILSGLAIASSAGTEINADYDFDGYEPPAASFSVSSARVENMVDGRYPWVISLSREMRGPDGSVLGYIQVDLNYAVIDEVCRNAQPGASTPGASGYVFILGPSGDIVYHPRQQLIYGGLKSELIPALLALRQGFQNATVDGRQVLYTAYPSPKAGWIVVVVSDMSELLSGVRRAVYSFALLSVLCFAAAIILSSLVSLRISRPIESLRRSMQRVERGDFDMDITVNCSNEVFQLARDCDIAVKKVRDLIAQNRAEAEERRILELRALQAQINPHFLYNTLDSIIWMIELGENERAIDVTSCLARFFRIGISRGSEVIPIRTEIEYLETYLTIQKTRYKDKLDYEIAFQPELYDCRILKLLVQPLVENAIYHGIKNKESPGMVRVSGTYEEGCILIRVIDDGVGMDDESLARLRRLLASTSKDAADDGAPLHGVGVRNVQERIRLFFGSGYGLSYESAKGSGTTATILIPRLMEAAK